MECKCKFDLEIEEKGTRKVATAYPTGAEMEVSEAELTLIVRALKEYSGIRKLDYDKRRMTVDLVETITEAGLKRNQEAKAAEKEVKNG